MSELKVITNTVGKIKKAKHLYLKDQDISANELAENLVDDAKHLGVKASVKKIGCWWCVYSDTDWLEKGTDESIVELFNNLRGLANAPQNSFRREVLLTAFADHVLTCKDEVCVYIKGKEKTQNELSDILKKIPKGNRIVAFCIEPNQEKDQGQP
ncbi:hypothetical protein [Aliikangiella coralliicola]|uniref:Uncharacterized protein n=1 Tax=Aliikangiella coralliicola TaxID=2592383 RepID=A0A545UET5_9GAMM|nr:hypothetical protein [Aliikangiella coralliicola]TQV87955.1 hypothetical protein FLL46_11290 [Aliikangiella coralliicola]